MDRYILNALTALECTPIEKKLFVACADHGSITVPALAKIAGVKRSTAYLAVESLIEKGLLIEDYKAYGKQVIAAEPKELLRKVAARQRRFGRVALALQENLAELQAAHQATATRPRVRTYQGFEGLTAVWQDILSSKTELLLWTNQEAEQKVFTQAHHDQFINERCRKNLHIRVLAVNNQKGWDLLKTDAEKLRRTRILSPGINFSTETYIYDDKIAMLDHNKAIIGIIIQSEQLAAAHRAMFESSWNISK